MLDVGEQIEGTSHVFEIAAPFNGGASEAQIAATITENPAFSIDSVPRTLAPINGSTTGDVLQEQLAKKIRVRFSPAEFNRDLYAELTFTATWPDGVTETRKVKLLGAARHLTSVPSPTREQWAATKQKQEEQVAAERSEGQAEDAYQRNRSQRELPAWASRRYDDAGSRATSAVNDIKDAQNRGIDHVIEAMGTYVPPPTPANVWWDLAKTAILLGSGTLTGIIVKSIASELAVSLGGAAQSSVASGIASTINGTLSRSIASALEHPPATESNQSHAKIAFFDAQTDAVAAISDAHHKTVTDHHDYHARDMLVDPEGAVAGMEAIKTGFEAAKPLAKSTQQHATAVEWLAFKSRLELGVEQLDDGTKATNLTKPRASKHPTPDGFKGLLDLVIDLEHGAPHVASARAPGIARALVGDIAASRLSEARVPMRIVVGWNEPEPTIITRDEGGRVRVAGNFGRLARFLDSDGHINSEAQAERAARALVEIALSRSLSEWGIEIQTDDRSDGK